MANPGGGYSNLIEEPSVEIRRTMHPSYGAATDDPFAAPSAPSDPAPSQPPEMPVSTNSVNTTDGDSLDGSFRRRDKSPLYNEEGERAGGISRQQSILSGVPGIVQMGRADGLGTFSGVVCPVALSMFSVLLFMRMGFVVGQAGILLTIGMLILAYGIIMLTVLSLCAISTNGAIEGGGVYYMISRALGPEFGGSIGVLFFIANVFSAALYISGFTESLLNNIGPNGLVLAEDSAGILADGAVWRFFYGACVATLILIICLVGSSLFATTSVMLIVALAIVYGFWVLSFFIGWNGFAVAIPASNALAYLNCTRDNETDRCSTVYLPFTGFSSATFRNNSLPLWSPDYTNGVDNKDELCTFAIVFAVIFSGVTGIMAGANMSGELKVPQVSIPRGTNQAIFITFIVYILTTILLGWTCSRELLINNYSVAQAIAVTDIPIVLMIFALTAFAAMSNIIGASRVLLRLAEDRIFGGLLYPMTIKFGRSKNPLYSVVFTWVLVLCVLAIGSLNKIAKLTTIFFLLSYTGVNLATLALDLASAPNFRPTFKFFNWQSALAGAAATLVMCVVVNSIFALAACILLLLLLAALHYKVMYLDSEAPVASWGSISQALIFHQVRKYLLLLDVRKEHVKYWRPQMVLLVRSPGSCAPLIDFVNDLKKSGLFIIGHVRVGDMNDYQIDPLNTNMPYWLSLIDFLRVKAFVELTLSRSVREGAHQLVRLGGIGAMKPNTIILGFSDNAAPDNTFASNRLLKSIRNARIGRDEVVEYFTGDDFLPQAQSSSDAEQEHQRLSAYEYVSIIADALKMSKNICLARHFYKLDKDRIFGGRSGEHYIDVWPIDIVRAGRDRGLGWDNSCLFLLQLACILSMSKQWKRHTTLRVFLCATSLVDMQRRERQLREMLGQLRISARSLVVPWDHVICHLIPTGAQSVDEGPEYDCTNLPQSYLRSLNEMIKKHSDNSGVVFLNIPAPPTDTRHYDKYLATLRAVTDDLPPTLMVHGLASVISLAL